jgi:hypothetical protein
MNMHSRLTEQPALEARLAARIAGALSARSETLPHDLSERLRVAREQAMARAREVRLAAPAGATVVSASPRGGAALGGFGSWWHRAAAALPLLALVGGLFMIQHWSALEQVRAAAEIDTQLLSGDLPPEAYSDPGFAEFLQSAPTP